MNPSDSPFDRWSSAWIAFLALAALFCFWGIGQYGYVQMEGMIGDGADHMLEGGDFLLPYVYDELYTYKPPLAYWLGTIPLLLTDGTPPAWFFRLPFVSCGLLLGALLLVVLGRRFRPLDGLACATVSMGGVLFLEKIRVAEFDTPLMLFTGAAVVSAIWSLLRERKAGGSALLSETASWLLVYALLFLAFLSKGVPAIMAFGPGLLIAAWLTGRFRRLFGPGHLMGGVVGAGLIGVYLLMTQARSGGAALDQPAAEAAVRGFEWGLMEVLRSLAKPVLVLVMLVPFSVLLPRAVGLARSSADSAKALWTRAGLGFLAGGTVAFAAVPTHEMRYLLPLIGAGAICFGLALADLFRRRPTGSERVSTIVLGVLAVLLIPLSFLEAPDRMVVPAIAVPAVACLVLAAARTFDGRRTVMALMACAVAVALAQSLFFLPRKAGRRDLVRNAEEISALLGPEDSLCVLGTADQAGKHSSLYFQLERRVYVLNETNPLRSGDWCLLVDDERELAEEMGLEVVATSEAHSYTYYLAAPLDDAPAESAPREEGREGQPAELVGGS